MVLGGRLEVLGGTGGYWGALEVDGAPSGSLMAFVGLPQESTLAHFMLIPPGQPAACTDMLIQLPPAPS